VNCVHAGVRIIIIGGLLLGGCTSSPQDPFSERRLALLPERGKPRGFTFSRDGRVVAYILDDAEKDYLIIGAIRGNPFDRI
jgi:hypothetical protein